MKVDDIITLSDDRKYLVLDTVEVEKENFILVAGLKDDEETPNNDYQIFKQKEENGKFKVFKINDDQKKADLLNLFAIKTVTEDTI